MTMDPRQRRDAFATAFDQRRAPGEEERRVGTDRGCDRESPLGVERVGAPHASSAASIAAAASDEPPPSPAATGMRFSRRAASGGVAGRPGPSPIAARAAEIARSTRFASTGPASLPVT
jgi:hypothetical protein